jgi:hypothetical protein
MDIPEAAVEAAAEAEWSRHDSHRPHSTWETEDPEYKEYLRMSMRTALTAAAPFLMSVAWEEGRDAEFQRSVMKRQTGPNPYEEMVSK